uniref:Uncharacterized protein n=1 Tax=Schizaphis graminum TaxID=13262 RepID=A0A2S2NTY8_SCHGA
MINPWCPPRTGQRTRQKVRRRKAGVVSGGQATNQTDMMNTTNNFDVTATGASETPEPAVWGRCSPQVSSSPTSTESLEVLRQASTARNGAGNSTAERVQNRPSPVRGKPLKRL